MRLRPYRNHAEDSFICRWINDARTHALWCANRIPFPLDSEGLRAAIAADEAEWGGCPYVYTEDDGRPVGFLMYSINDDENSGFVKYIMVDPEKRGTGTGSRMLRLLLTYAFSVTGVSVVRLNVFDSNPAARRCYEKAGFREKAYTADAFSFEGESWGRTLMEAERMAAK